VDFDSAEAAWRDKALSPKYISKIIELIDLAEALEKETDDDDHE
jgi:hypothetical protein